MGRHLFIEALEDMEKNQARLRQELSLTINSNTEAEKLVL